MLELVYDTSLPACQQQHCRPDCQALRLRANQLTTFSGLPASSSLHDSLALQGATLCHAKPARPQTLIACQHNSRPHDKRSLYQYLLHARIGRQWFRRPQEIDREAVSHILHGLALDTACHSPLNTLPAEQRALAEVAHAMVQAAPVVLLDLRQPALGTTLRRRVLRYLVQRAIHGRTILCALHQASDSEGLSHWHITLGQKQDHFLPGVRQPAHAA